MKRIIFCALLLCATGCVRAMDSDDENSTSETELETGREDEVAVDILEGRGEEGRIMQVEGLISLIDAKRDLEEVHKANLRGKLTKLSVEKFNDVAGKFLLRKKNKRKTSVAEALLLVADQLELQVEEMRSSGVTQQNAYKQQVRTAQRATYSAIAAGGVGAISLLFNILQGAGVFE